MIISDATSCGVTYNCQSDYSRGVVYTPRVINYAPIGHLHDDPHGMNNIFL